MPTYRYRLAACRKESGGSDSAAVGMPCCTVGHRRIRQGTSGDASYGPHRSVPCTKQISVSLNPAWKAAAWSPAAREDFRRRQSDIRARPLKRSRLDGRRQSHRYSRTDCSTLDRAGVVQDLFSKCVGAIDGQSCCLVSPDM
jgi:hypothetical protein